MPQPKILGGSARGRTLHTPKEGTRPSPARLREALFNLLAFRERGRFLDLYSGSGAVGLEAASRGWSSTCIDLGSEATRVAAGNARRLRLRARVLRGDALAYACEHRGAFDVVFAAPPYPLDLRTIFAAIVACGPAAPGGLYIFQHPSDLEEAVPDIDGATDVRRYGSNALTLIDAPNGRETALPPT